MATLLNSESRRLYSWWWDSHISPKNSKWLQENLTDMDAKVKAMIKLIEEDADSFARRAEMYYKKRPELMKLVEEFYRAYRALAERYDHATVELRQAHRTMAEAFPNQVPYVLSDDSPSSSSVQDGEPHTPEVLHPIRTLLEPDDLQKDILGLSSATLSNNGAYFEESKTRSNKKGLKQLNDMFKSKAASEGSNNAGDKKRGPKPYDVSANEIRSRDETEILTLGKTLLEIEAEKDAILLQYQQSLQKLSSVERELMDARGLEEQLSRAETEIKVLREALLKLEAARDAGLLQYNKCLEKIAGLENMIIHMQEDAKGLHEQASRAEMEAKNLKQYHSKLKAEKEADLLQYNQCLEMISELENKIFIAEKNARTFNEQAEQAETEVKNTRQDLHKMNEEKESAELRYEQCLERISSMQNEIFHAQENAKRLNDEILTAVSKLKVAEEQCSLLESSNKSLRVEADNLAHKIAVKDRELLEKEHQLEKLQTSLTDEHSRFVEIEATFQGLQKLHSQSQEEQVSLAKELQNRLQMLKDLETCNRDLQKDLLQAKVENQSLDELTSSSILSITNLRKENTGLMEMKEKLKEKVSLQLSQSDILHREIHHLKEEIKGLSRRYQAITEQVNSVGLDPECFASSIKELQNENLQLKEAFRNDKDEKEVLYDKLKDMDNLLEKNVALKGSVSELKGKLEGSTERIKEMQESCQFLRGEKSELHAEKVIVLSQLQVMTENVQKLLDKNTLLENSLSGAHVELEGLRSKSKSLEDMCQILKDEKSNLLTQKHNLVTQLEDVEQRLGNLEIRFSRLEEKYIDLEKEKEFSCSQVKELWSYLGVEKQEHANYIQSSNSRLVNLENEFHALQQERKLSKKEFEEELDKAVNAQLEIFILQKFVQDLEEKNLSLLFECQKYVEASKLSNKLMSELETENLEQQVELEFLLDETEKMKIGLDQIFRGLQFDLDNGHGHVMNDAISVSPILDGIEDLKTSLRKNEDEKQKLVVENLVHLTLLRQLELEGHEVRSEKKILEQDFKIMHERCELLEKAKHALQQTNRQLSLEMEMAKNQEEILRAELEKQHDNLLNMEALYHALQEKNYKAVAENGFLLQKFLDVEGKLRVLEEDCCNISQESVALNIRSVVLQGFGIEKVEETKTLFDDLSCLNETNSDLNEKIKFLGKKLDAKEIDSRCLCEIIEKLKQEMDEGKDLAHQLHCQISIGNIFLRQKAEELLQAEQELKAMDSQNSELFTTTEDLKRECEESEIRRDHMERKIVELSEDITSRNEEIACLNSENEKLESLVGMLSKEVQERRSQEENLTLELQERSNEFELWEAEASSFYFDLQVSSVREVLLENKVHELTKACESLEEEKGTKDIEIELMRERSGLLENEIGGLKAQLSAYVPVIAALRDDIESLQDNTLQRRNQFSIKNQGPKAVEMDFQSHEMNHDEIKDDETALAVDGISALLKMRSTIKAIERTMVGEMNRLATDKAVVEDLRRLKMQKEAHSHIRQGSQRNIAEFLNEENEFPAEDIAENSKSCLNKPETSELRNGIMKDIPLDEASDSSSCHRVNKRNTSADDQMLELWESSENDCCIHGGTNETKREVTAPQRNVAHRSQFKDAKQNNQENLSLESQVEKEVGIDKLEVPMSILRGPNRESSERKLLERLSSDAKKLASFQKTLQDLKMRLDGKKQGKTVDCLEFERLKTQLHDVEEAVMELVDTNDHLTNNSQESCTSSEANPSVGSDEAIAVHGNTMIERAHEGSERIKSLQLELQGIWSAVLKLEAEKKNKGKHRFLGTRTGILLKNFIHSGSSRRRKKPRFCGCARPSPNED